MLENTSSRCVILIFLFNLQFRFFTILETLVDYGLSGPTCSLAFSESVLNVVNQSAALVENKEHLWRMWSIVVNPLTERVIQVCCLFSPSSVINDS